jgi:hypothetical protein
VGPDSQRPTHVESPDRPSRSYSGIALLSAAWQVKDLDISSELMRKGESLLQQFQRSSSGAKLKEEVSRVSVGSRAQPFSIDPAAVERPAHRADPMRRSRVGATALAGRVMTEHTMGSFCV